MVLIEQISALIDFLENHQYLALGHCSRTIEGRSLSKTLWIECAQILNSISVDCPNKTPAEWRTFYNEYKSKTLKKVKSQKSEISATGGGPAKKFCLTQLQERLYTLLRRDIGESLPGVLHDPVTPTITFPVVDASPSTSSSNNFQLENNSFSSSEQENIEDRPSTFDQPPKRKRRQSSARRYASQESDYVALEVARVDRIEARNAEATLKHAQAINNLAAAIDRQTSTTEKMVDILGQFMASVSKKKLRRLIVSSDSESD